MSVAAGCVRLTCGRRVILGNAVNHTLLNPIFLAHTSLKEHALNQTLPDLKLDPAMTLTMPHLKISTRLSRPPAGLTALAAHTT